MSSTPPHSTAAASSRGLIRALALTVLAMVPVVLWPGDVAFLVDEPRLLAMAWHANHTGVLATAGLAGNFGVRYGPLGVQVYQALLLVTHDPYRLVVLRGLLCGGATALGLLWLGRTLRLPLWFAAAVLVAPLVVAYQRVLWDASFAIPVGTLAVAALADFAATRRVWSLRMCLGAAVMVPLIHPQGLPLFLAVIGWLGRRHREAIRRDWSGLVGVAAIILVLNGVYFALATGDVWWRVRHATPAVYPGAGSRLLSSLAPLLGGNLLSGVAAVRPVLPEAVLTACVWASRAIYPLAWVGIALAVQSLFAPERGAAAARDLEDAEQGSPARVAVFAVVLCGLAGQTLLFGALRIPCAPQYFFGTFPLHVLPAWLAVDALRRWRLGAVLAVLYAAGNALLTLGTMIEVHRHGYAETQWPTLRDSVEVARALNHFTDAEVTTEVEFYARYPQALRTLRLLLPPSDADAPRPSGRLLITRAASDTASPWSITLGEVPPGVALPSAPRLDVTPLPSGWIPPRETW